MRGGGVNSTTSCRTRDYRGGSKGDGDGDRECRAPEAAAVLIADDAIGGISGAAIVGSASLAAGGRVINLFHLVFVVDMIIFMGAPMMTMCRTGNPTDTTLGVVATAHRMGHRPQATLGRLEMMQRLQRMIRAIRSGIFLGEHACLFGGLLACLFQRLWYAVLMGRRRRRVVDPRS